MTDKWRQWAKPDKSMVQCEGWGRLRNLWSVLWNHYLPMFVHNPKPIKDRTYLK